MFVQRFVDDMGCVRRPTPNEDVVIDGEIELAKDGNASGHLVKIQVKSGTSYIANTKAGTLSRNAIPVKQFLSG